VQRVDSKADQEHSKELMRRAGMSDAEIQQVVFVRGQPGALVKQVVELVLNIRAQEASESE